MVDASAVVAEIPHIRKALGATSAALALATSFIAPWEGHRSVGYLDIVGVPTYCYGGTGSAAVVGRHYSDVVCRSQLSQDVASHAEAIRPCLTAQVPDPAYAAFISLSYNVGAKAFCHSTVARQANAGHMVASCNAILLYNRAGGRVVQGLANRRAAERRLCLSGLN